MRIINQKRQKASKSVEQSGENLKSHSVAATSTGDFSQTDASQPSAVNDKRSWLHRLKQRLNNRVPRSVSLTSKHEKQQHKSKTSKSLLRRRMNNLDSHQERDDFRTVASTSSELNNETQSQLDGFKMLKSNSGVATSLNNQQSGRKKKLDSLDQDFKPSIHPLMCSNADKSPKSRWGTMDLAASSKVLEDPLNKFKKQNLRRRLPSFRLGPRRLDIDADGCDRASVVSSDASQSTASLLAAEPKYCFISQDGKLVEREVFPWPFFKATEVTMRYKVSEPYASNYGKCYTRRVEQGRMLPSTRYIFEKPIYRLPQALVNENKQRLLARYALKTNEKPESGKTYCMPMKLSVLETEQSKRYREFEKRQQLKDAMVIANMKSTA